MEIATPIALTYKMLSPSLSTFETPPNMNLPEGAKFEVEMQWGHIGWSVPATFGYAVKARGRRIVLMVGDGSFQLTAQEVCQMIRLKLPVLIFLINNRGYTIEVEIHDGPYNNIKNWDYAGLIEVFNARLERALACSPPLEENLRLPSRRRLITRQVLR